MTAPVRFPPSFFLSLVATLLATTALADTFRCPAHLSGELRTVEANLGWRLAWYPIAYPDFVTAEELSQSDERTALLLANGLVRVESVSRAERRALGLYSALDHIVRNRFTRVTTRTRPLGTLHRLLSVNSLECVDRGPETLAVEHRQTNDVLDRLRRIGVTVYFDSTLGLSGMSAFYADDMLGVAIGPLAPFPTLLHEARHAEYDRYRVKRFLRLARERLRRGESLESLYGTEPYVRFGRAGLEHAVSLQRAGYPEEAIDERLAVEAEVAYYRAYRGASARLIPTLVDNALHYANEHLMTALADVAEMRRLRPNERLTFFRATQAFLENDAERNRAERRLLCRYGRLLASFDPRIEPGD